jgi:hypothetical protein
MDRRLWRAAAVCLAVSAGDLAAQTCTMAITGYNRARTVTGPVHAECSGGFHSAPFGNWGATSNYGQKKNGHQFDGWCYNRFVCDNWGNCRSDCRDGWYEWNSCTDIPQFQPANCYLYNAAGCTRQASATDFNALGTFYLRVTTDCPYDTNGDGFCDSGGCKDIRSVTVNSNYMSLYELDPICCDSLVQSLYFPATTVPLSCAPWSCPAAGSNWVVPSFYQSPSSPPKVSVNVAMVENWASFSDPYGRCASMARTNPKYNCR